MRAPNDRFVCDQCGEKQTALDATLHFCSGEKAKTIAVETEVTVLSASDAARSIQVALGENSAPDVDWATAAEEPLQNNY